ncbi:MAG TPA: YqaJ viral recombinase family protein [Xanthobacteraceae bacterium]|nr:YqaJ viral recombinase family protein [Xanthobacteraceae bacterium]
MSLSPDQLARRLEGITATDVSAICNVNPWRSRISVWAEKRGEAPPWVDTDRSRWGEILEPPIRKDYGERHGVRVEVPGTLQHPEAEWMLATPDGVAYRGAEPVNGLEIKCHTIRLAHMYGAPGTDEIPLHEICQDMWNLAVTGLERWDHVVFLDGQPVEYTVMRDDDVIGELKATCERFLIDNIRGGAVPEPDGSEAFSDWLLAKWKANPNPLVALPPGDDALQAIARAKVIREEAAALEVEHEQIIQALKLRIRDFEGLTWANDRGKPEKITWKRSKPSVRVDMAGLARDSRQDAQLVLSGQKATLERALICLKSHGMGAIGASSRAAMTGAELAELVTSLQTTLGDIARRTDAAYSREIPGNRPFYFPRAWAAPASAKEQ